MFNLEDKIMYISEDAKVFIIVLITVSVMSCLLIGALFLWRALDEPSTEARYQIHCVKQAEDGAVLSGGGIDGDILTDWRATYSGFWVYYLDGTSDWLSSGNSCKIREIKK